MLRGIGYGALFLCVYLVALWRFFPYPELARLVENRLGSEGISAEIQGLGPAAFAGLHARRVSLAPLDKSWEPIQLDDVEAGLPITRWLRGERAVSMAARVLGGRLQTLYFLRNTPLVSASWTGLDLSRVPLPEPVKELPISGRSSGSVEVHLDPRKLDKLSGQLDTSFEAVSLGAGKVQGIPLPEVGLGNGKIRLSAEEGKVDVEGITFEGGGLGVDFKGSLLLRDRLSRSLVNGVLSLRPNEKVSKDLGLLFAVFPGAKSSDGRYTARVRGSLDSPRLLRR